MRGWAVVGAGFGARFAALRLPPFRRYWFGSAASVGAFQLLIMGQGWLVYELSGSPLQLGFLGAASSVPTIIASLAGGVVADRVDQRRLIIATSVTIAALLGLLAALDGSGGGGGLARTRHRRDGGLHHRLRLPDPPRVLPEPHRARPHDECGRPQRHAVAGHPHGPARAGRRRHRPLRHLGRVRARRRGVPHHVRGNGELRAHRRPSGAGRPLPPPAGNSWTACGTSSPSGSS